ncbi:MAG TPA: potassium-transporting ATPase subunit KdpC [Steroidobacteraceae bacterium]|nr:potassium-transporting ATPase subunit KdpC [Steroidobacteraceae bacterium]
MLKETLRPAASLLLAITVLLGLGYPLAITGIAELAFPHQAGGSIVLRDGVPVGSSLIGQSFSDPKHFWGRPSATTPQPYNGIGSTGSNLGPLNPALIDAVKANAKALREADPDNHRPIPVDLVTASASGLDPEISAAAALYQVARVARVRGLDPARVEALVGAHERVRPLALIGESSVNVLELNLALDELR